MSLIKRPFYYIRHGQTSLNYTGIAVGRADESLSNLGVQQALHAQSILQGLSIKTICHSPLKRARETAEIINKNLNCPLIEIADLRECDWGIYEGKPVGPWIEEWYQGASFKGMETIHTFSQRILKGTNEALSYVEVLIVSHGAAYWILQDFMDIQDKRHIEPCVPLYHEPLGMHWYVTLVGEDEEADLFE